MQLSRSNQEVLSSTGINITHVPHAGKNSADRALLVDLMYWVSQNPPPAHLFLISGDRDFANILHRLRLNNYNILLSSPDSAPGVLCSAASIMWQWNALVRGENLTGRHFNQPPDGPSCSWYGHYRLPLEDPFAVSEKPACSGDENSSESVSELKLRPVPTAVMKQICNILNSYPEGISITNLREELAKTDVSLAKDFYGYKRFSRFLLSMPHILKIKSLGEGNFSVRNVAAKVLDSVEGTPGITSGRVTNNGDLNQAISAKRCGSEEKSSLPSSQNVNGRVPLRNLQESPKQVEEPIKKVLDPPPLVMKANNAEVAGEPLTKLQKSLKHVEEPLNEVPDAPPLAEKANNAEKSHLNSVEEQDPTSEVGYPRNNQRKWVGAKDSGSEESNCGKPDKYATSSTEKTKEAKKNCVESTSKYCVDENVSRSCEANDNRSSRGPGFFNRIIRWFKFWSSQKSDNANELSSDKMSLTKGDSEEHHIFSTESFWNEIVVFIDTHRGSDVIMKSKTRIEMAQNLQKQGPSVLRNLIESDLLYLVDLLISDKKWVEECPLEKFPFKLIQPIKKGCVSDDPPSNGLRSIFLDTQSQSQSQSPPEQRVKKFQNLPHTGVCPPATLKNPSKFSSEALADCQKLVDYIVKRYPEGFSMGSFRKLFLERYGYYLDVQKLGYQNLASVLQIMPGVKIESTYIMPALPSGKLQKRSGLEVIDPSVSKNNVGGKKTNYDSNLSDASRASDNLDWEELGPVVHTNPERKEMEGLSRKVKERNHNYETLSDDDFSDSDDESLSSTGSEGHGKPLVNVEDSSLLQILDSWHRSKEKENSSSKEDDTRRVASENVDGVGDCSRKHMMSSSSSRVSLQSDVHEGSYGQKPRPSKSYSFVSDQVGDGKDKLIDGILGSLKKSGERSAETRIQA